MNEEKINSVTNGLGSYVAFICMVTFAMIGTSTWLIIPLSLLYGWMAATIINFTITVIRVVYPVLQMLSGYAYGNKCCQNAAMMYYAEYIYEYSKEMSNVRKRVG
jgi:hydrogenase/urease accessory protein HupE